MTSSVTIPGLRVLRGPDWDQSEADGGEGHLGTVVGVKAEDGTAEVVWDNGQVTTCRVGKEGKHDLRIYDNAAAGVSVSRGVVCQGCRNSSIYGTSWRCSTCSNLHLCSRCYHLGVHPLSHHFLRQDDLTQQGTAVGARSQATRVQVYGMFPEARVARGRDWQAGDVDGGPDGSGVVVEVVSPESGSARNAVRVSWDSGQSLQHRLGLHGKVDLVCTEEAPGPACYVSHLPVLALLESSSPRLQTPTSTLGAEARQPTDTNLQADTNHATTQAGVQQNTNVTVDTKPEVKADANARMDTEIRVDTDARVDSEFRVETEGEIGVGDRVEVGVDLDTFRDIQTQVASWTRDMAECIGSVGVVKEVTGLGNVKVTFGDDSWILSPICLKKTTKSPTAAGSGRKVRPKTGDRVRIVSDVRLLEEQQRNHGGWVRDMAQAAGKVGTVLTLNYKGDVVVQFGQRHWIFNPDSCTPAPGCSVDFIPADSSDGLLEGLKRQLDDLLPSDDAILDAASSPRLRGLFTAIKAEDATKVAKLLDDYPGLVRESALEATALHYAAFKGNVEAVRLLVAKGADINKGDKDDDTPLIRAVHRKRTEAARALIELGADVNLSNEKGQTPLHSAVIANSIDIVRLLLHNMASVNRRDLQGDTPLFDAMQVDNLDPAILDILLATGDLDLRVVNKRGFNALLMAAIMGRPRAVERILARDSSLLTSVVEEGRHTALHIACANNHVDVIKVLVQAKAPLDARSHELATPLHLACSEDHLMSARILVENGADVNAVDINWDTPLHECFSESKNPASQLLGTSARGPNKGLEVAKFLLQHGARHFLRNRQGKTALDGAPESVREKLTSFLSQPREAAAATTAKPPAPPEAPGKMANNENGSSSAKCATCHQREADVIFLPCAHKLVCRQCAGSTKSCRECGVDIKSKVDTKGKPVQEKPSEATPDTKSSASQKIKVGDTVRITADVNRLEQNQAHHGGWTEDMTQAAGKVGKVMSLTPSEDLVVQFGQQFWVFNADSCIPAPGSTPDFIALNELSHRENNLRGELNSPSPGLLGKDLGRLMEDATAFLNGPSRLKDLFKAIVSDDQREMAALLDKEPELVNATVANSTAVHFAAYSGRVGAIRLLVGRGASVNMRDNNQDSPLCTAIHMRRMEAARVLLELGADVNQQNTKGLAPLHLAVIFNSLDITRLLLQNMASVNLQDLKGNSPLLIAIEKNDTDQAIVEALLVKGDLDLRLTNQQGFNALHRAALRDKPRTVSAILARDQSLVTTVITDGKFTALHIAAANNHTDVIKILLRAHAAIDARDHTSQTPLHLASSEDYLESSRILVENGADINAVDAQRNTPLHLCFEMNLQMLLGKGPSREKKGAEVAKFLIQRGARTDIRNTIGQLALEKAPEPVRRQLEALKTSNAVPQPTRNQNADQSFGNTGAPKNDDGDSAQCTMCHQREADVIFLPCAHKLVCRQCAQSAKNCRQCGQAINMKVDTKGKPLGKAPSPSNADNTKPAGLQNEQLTDLTGRDYGDVVQAAMGFLTSPSPLQDLFHAVQSEQTAKVTEMIEREPSLLEETMAGANVLHFAALNGKPESVRILVAKGADINKGDTTGETPLMRSVHTNQVETARVLLELGADVNKSNMRSFAPLHVAVALNHTEMVLLLLRNKASVNKQERGGNTPLHAGLTKDGVSDTILDALMAAEDLDLKLTTNQQATPLHTAVHFNRTRVMQKILARDSSLVNVPMDEGFTPLHLAAQNNRVDAMRILLKARAHVNAREETGRTPLHVACSSDYLESARVLMENGADVNAADFSGNGPLHKCVGFHTSRSQLLHRDKGLELAKYLIQHGARTDARDNRGKTPLDMASNNVEEKLKHFLRERGLLPDKKQNDDDISNTPSASPSSPSDKCVACHQRQADVIFLPCAHKLVCHQCAGSAKNCLKCGTEVVRRVDTEGKSVDASSSSSAAVSGEEDAGNQVQECKVQ